MPLDRLLRVDRPPENASLKVLRRVPYKDIWIEAVEVASAPHVWLPAWLFRARTGEGGKPVLVALEPYGRNRGWHEGEMYPQLALKGYTVCVPDLRGIGDSTATPDGYDAANMAEDIHQLVEHLHLEHVYVVGHDIGGMVAYAFVRRYP